MVTNEPTAPPETASEQTAAPRRRRVQKIVAAVALLLVVALAAGTAYVYRIDRSVTQNITRADNLPSDSPPAAGQSARPPARATGALDYVLLGSDSRDPDHSGNGRSDSIMVVHRRTGWRSGHQSSRLFLARVRLP